MTSSEDRTDSNSTSDAPDLEPVLDPEETIDAAAEELDLGDEHHEVVGETTAHDLGDDSELDPIESTPDVGAAKPSSARTAPRKDPTTKPLPPKAKAKAKANAKAGGSSPRTAAADGTARGYTAPGQQQFRPPSPVWVPIAMFGLWGFGLLVIILNYMDVLPGTGDGGNGWYLIAGLVAILGGIVAATKYH